MVKEPALCKLQRPLQKATNQTKHRVVESGPKGYMYKTSPIPKTQRTLWKSS